MSKLIFSEVFNQIFNEKLNNFGLTPFTQKGIKAICKSAWDEATEKMNHVEKDLSPKIMD